MKDVAKTARRFWKGTLGSWAPYLEIPVPAGALLDAMGRASVPSFGFYFMLGLAAAIATFGLIGNSAPAIIGAMIIAPLMSPIMSLAYGLVCFDRHMIVRSAISVSTGTALVVAIAYACAEGFGLRLVGSEVIARTSPTLLDLGVALAAGAAAAFSQTRPSIANSVAGVAIAVALVPPLAVAGIGIALGRAATLESGISLTEFGSYGGTRDIAEGAFTLFLTNLIGIIGISMIVFTIQGYGQVKRTAAAFSIIVISSIVVIPTLDQAFEELYVKNRVVRLFSKASESRSNSLLQGGKIDFLNVKFEDDALYIYIDILLPPSGMENLETRIEKFRAILSADIGESVIIDMDVIPVEIVSFKSKKEK